MTTEARLAFLTAGLMLGLLGAIVFRLSQAVFWQAAWDKRILISLVLGGSIVVSGLTALTRYYLYAGL